MRKFVDSLTNLIPKPMKKTFGKELVNEFPLKSQKDLKGVFADAGLNTTRKKNGFRSNAS